MTRDSDLRSWELIGRDLGMTLAVLFMAVVLNSFTSSSCSAEPKTQGIDAVTGQLTQAEKPLFGEEDAEKAKEIFQTRCVRCHGKIGDGRGTLASHLSPRPTDLTNSFWYKTTTPKTLKKVILGGGGAIGKSVLMPANPDLRNKPKVVAALIQYIIDLAPRESE